MITRRTTLIAGGIMAALGLSPAVPAASAADDIIRAKAKSLGAVLGSHESALAVGRAYLAAHPDEANLPRLLGAIEAAAGIGDDAALPLPPQRHAATAQAVALAVREDFLERRTVKIDGWVLARTEARLCALIALG